MRLVLVVDIKEETIFMTAFKKDLPIEESFDSELEAEAFLNQNWAGRHAKIGYNMRNKGLDSDKSYVVQLLKFI